MKTLLCILFAIPVIAAEFKAGVAKIKITPDEPTWMSGYAGRSKPSQGVIQDLWVKALALDDGKGRAVIVTSDIIGLPRSITDLVSARLQKQHGLDRSRILFNSSHTHTGPVVGSNLAVMYDLDPEQQRRVQQFTDRLTEALFNAVGSALSDLAPAAVEIGHGEVKFAMNRREYTPEGVKIGENPKGPTDHDVPVLKVTTRDGKVKAILYAYACHNTTLTGEFYQLSGDYAGFSQTEIEKATPGATALFVQLCGGDQNPSPRSTLAYAEQHGKSLAAEVVRVAQGKLAPVRPPLRSAYRVTELEFAPHSREQFEKDLNSKSIFEVRRAKDMLKAYEQGRPIRRTPYPVQAIRFGNDLTLLALGGEVVIDYNLRAKREYGTDKEHLIVAGYSNDVMCYIPSLRVLKEGGYEAESSMIYYGQPGKFNEQVEETVFEAIRSVMNRVGRKPVK